MSSHIYSNPKKYSKNNALQYNFAMTVLSKISFNAKSRVLDLGCGDGIITCEIAKIVNEGCVLGTDISTEMVEFAGKEFTKQSNLRFLQMDASKNIFREQFDIITSFNCLHWVKEQQSALNGIARAAVEGAQIALLLSHRKSPYHLVLDKICSSVKWKQYFSNFVSPRSFFDRNVYAEMVIKSGLEITNIAEEEMTFIYNTKEQLREFFHAAGAQIKQIPENRKDEFLDDFVNEFLEQVKCEEDDIIPVSFWCLQVIATKPVLKPSFSSDNKSKPTHTSIFCKL